MAELIARGALGAISTHDAALCEIREEHARYVIQVHLRESVDKDQMSFDYKVRPGPVSTGNALRLMRALGLDVPLEDPS